MVGEWDFWESVFYVLLILTFCSVVDLLFTTIAEAVNKQKERRKVKREKAEAREIRRIVVERERREADQRYRLLSKYEIFINVKDC